MRNLSPPRSLVSLQGQGGGVLLLLETEEELLVETGVVLVELESHPRAQDEVLVPDQKVVVDVEALASGELFPEVDPELVRERCCGSSC